MKTCNRNCCCQYKQFGSAPICSYTGYCDFQAPRDSRDDGIYKTIKVETNG